MEQEKLFYVWRRKSPVYIEQLFVLRNNFDHIMQVSGKNLKIKGLRLNLHHSRHDTASFGTSLF